MPEQEIKEVETTETEAARFPVGAALGAFTGKQFGAINGNTTFLRGAAVGTEATPPNDTEEAEPVTEEPEFISNEDYRELLALAINDAEVWVSQAESLINKIDNGEKIKGTKLNGAVRNGRLEILRSSLTDVKTAKVSG
jgi:hypothetical protein